MQKFIGTGVALVTPFKEDLSVDFTALIQLVNYNIENGTDYLVINGTTGESGTITKEEKQEIIDVVIQTNNKRLPLVLGVGGNNTALVLETFQVWMEYFLLHLITANLHKKDFISILKPLQMRQIYQ